MSYHIDRNDLIHAPASQIFALVNDPARLHDINPDITVVSHQPSPLGGHDTHWEYSYGAIKLSGRSQVLAYEPNKRLVVETHGGIPSHWLWQFEPEHDGTRVSISL